VTQLPVILLNDLSFFGCGVMTYVIRLRPLRPVSVRPMLCVVDRRLTSQNIWGGFLYGRRRVQARAWNDFGLIPTAKIETRHPVEGSLGNEFPSIYNYCGVMAAWSRKMLKKSFFAFFWKSDIASPIDLLCSNLVKFGRREIGIRYNRALLTWQTNFAWLSSSLYCSDHTQNLPELVPESVLRVLQIRSKSVHFRWSYTRMREHRQKGRAAKCFHYSAET